MPSKSYSTLLLMSTSLCDWKFAKQIDSVIRPSQPCKQAQRVQELLLYSSHIMYQLLRLMLRLSLYQLQCCILLQSRATLAAFLQRAARIRKIQNFDATTWLALDLLHGACTTLVAKWGKVAEPTDCSPQTTAVYLITCIANVNVKDLTLTEGATPLISPAMFQHPTASRHTLKLRFTITTEPAMLEMLALGLLEGLA